MRWIALALVAMSGVLVASSADAAQLYTVSLKSLGGADTVTFTARFSDQYVVDVGDSGYQVAGVAYQGWNQAINDPTALPTVGPQFWRIDVGQYTYGVPATDEFGPFYEYENEETGEYRKLMGPALLMKDGRVVGFSASSAIYNYQTPVLVLYTNDPAPFVVDGYSREARLQYMGGYIDIKEPAQFAGGQGFRIGDFWLADTPGWVPPGPIPSASGIWDYENSTVVITSIPEPSGWALMILGFGAAGVALRRRQHIFAA